MLSKMRGIATVGFIIALVAAGISMGAAAFYKMKDDNLLEEAAEEVIRVETGVDVDLTPGSPEK